MSKYILTFISISLFYINSSAQLTVTPATVAPFTPTNLIDQVFLGDGVEVLNITYTGSNAAVGHFIGGLNTIGIEEGIVMTTGEAAFAGNNSNASGTTGTSNIGGSEPDLVTISGNTIDDAAIYNITFIPASDTLEFKYVFASEEYPEFVCNINDVFGFFINGPGINGTFQNMATNIALVPNSNTPVGVNTINGGNVTPGCVITNNQYYIDNENGALPFEYDGFTTVLTARAIVTPCDTYQIKLAIGDAFDDLYDSGVFLAANSFGTRGLTVNANTPNFTSTIAEGCTDAEIVFRLENVAAANTPLNYTIGGNAIMGTDYDPIPLTGTIPAGQDSFAINVSAILDNLNEGTDTIAFFVSTTSCTNDTFYVYIVDPIIVPPNVSDVTICYDDTTTLDATLPLVVSNGASFSNNNSSTFNHNSAASSSVNVSGIPLKYYQIGVIDSVCVNITHSNDEDLDIYLYGPDGAFIELSTDNGGTGNNYTNTCFTLDTSNNIVNGTAPFNGNFAPEGDWNDLDGERINAVWRLVVIDDSPGSNGTLVNWSLHFAPIYNITYDWSPTDSLSCPTCPITNAYPDTTTTYYITTTDTYGCISMDSSIVTVVPQLDTPQLQCAVVTSEAITVNWLAIPNVSSYELRIDNGAWIPLAANVNSYTYSNLMQNQSVQFEVRVLDALCPPSEIDTIVCTTLICTVNNNIGSINNVSCHNGSNGSSIINTLNPIGPVNYTLNGTVQTNGSFTNLSAGNYEIFMIDSVACRDTISFTITQPTPLVIDSLAATLLFCNNDGSGTATVFPSGGTPNYTYTWNTIPVQTNATATGLQANNYTITVTDANNCTITDNITVAQPPALTTNITATPVFCNGQNTGTATITPTGGTMPYTYQWSTVPIQNTDTAKQLVAGKYFVTVSDANNCSVIDSIIVAEPNVLQLSIDTIPVSCFGLNDGKAWTTVTGGNTAFSYNWNSSPTQNTDTLFNQPTGNYQVIVTDNKNCQDSISIFIRQPDTLTVSLSKIPVQCFNENSGFAIAVPQGGNGNYTYNWSVPQTTDTIINLSIGNYQVTVSDSKNCTATGDITVTQPPILNLSLTQTPTSCFQGNDGTASVAVTGGIPNATGNYSFEWNSNPPQFDSIATNLTALQTYTVTVTDANNCIMIDSITITEPPLLTGSINTEMVSCSGLSDGQAAVIATGGNGTYSYVWNTIPPQTTDTAFNLIAGNYQVTVTDINNCTSILSTTITQPATLSISTTGTDSDCWNTSNGSATTTVNGGTLPYTYLWDTATIPTLATNNTLNVGRHYVTVTDANNCSIVDSIDIGSPAPITTTINENPASCFGVYDGSISVAANGGTGGLTYAWNTSPVQTTTALTNLFSAEYIVTVTDNSGCIALDTGVIAGPVILSALKDSVPVTCFGGSDGSVMSTPSGGTGTYTYTWNNDPNLNTASLTNIIAGTYSVYVADANGCARIDSMVVNTPPELLANLTTTPVSCNGFSDGTVSIAPSGGTSGYTHNWFNNTSAPTVSNLASGAYALTLTDANSCTIFDTIQVIQPDAIQLSIDTIPVSCFGLNDGKAWTTVTGGNTSFTYDWNSSPVQNTDTLFNQFSGNYQVIVTDNKNCQDSISAFIRQPDTLTVSLSEIPVKCFDGNDGFAIALPQGGNGNYTYNWSVPQTTDTITNLSIGNYQVTVSDSKNCTATGNITVTEPPILNLSLTQTPTSCFQGNDGTASVAVIGGFPNISGSYSFEWNTVPPQFTSLATNLTALQTYTVTVTDANNCIMIDSIMITQPLELTTSTTMTPVFCNGQNTGTATVSPTGGIMPYNYQWNSNPIQNTPIATQLTAGKYFVTVTDANNCVTIDSIDVIEPNVLQLSIDTIPVSCFGLNDGKAWTTVTGGNTSFSYSWNSSPVQNTDTLFNQPTGNYQVIVTDNKNCQDSISIFIRQPDTLIVNLSEIPVKCFGGNDGFAIALPQGGNGNYNYNWSVPQTTDTITSLSIGNYQVTVADSKNCTATGNITVTEPPILNLSLTQTPTSCFQGNDGTASVSVVGGFPNISGSYSFEWNTVPPQFTSLAINLTALQTYTVTVTDGNNCIMVDSITITQPLELTTTIAATPVLCHSENTGTATVSPTGGIMPYSYQWNSNPIQNTPFASQLPTGQYFVTVTDGNNCTTIDSVIVTEPDTLSITLDSINISCFGFNDGKAWATVTGGVQPLQYTWDGGTTPSPDTLSQVPIGTYLFEVTDANNCYAAASITLMQPDTLANTFATDSVKCFGGNDGSIISTITGGMGNYTYQWSNTPVNSNLNSSLIAGIYTLSVTDDNNCITIDSIEIYEPAPFDIQLTQQPPTCYNGTNGSAALTANGGIAPYVYSWNTTETTDTIFNLSGGTTYTVTATDQNNCSITKSIEVVNPDTLILTMLSTDEACQSGGNGTTTAQLTGGFMPYSYAWDSNSNNQTTETATNLATGNYSVTVNDALGCQATGTVNVALASGIALTSTIEDVLCKGAATGTAKIDAVGGSGNYNYSWDANTNSQTAQTAIQLTAGTYAVTVTDTLGCQEITTIFINEPDQFLDFSIDSVKSVNCYGDQDGFIRVQGFGGVPRYEFSLNNGDFKNARAWFGLKPDLYTISIKDAHNCILSDTIRIEEPPLFTVDLGQDVFIAEDDTFTVQPIFENGVLPFTMLWQPADTAFMSCTDCPSPTWIGLQNTTYYQLLATDANGCITTDDILISINKALKIYVPTGFAPNNNALNEVLFVQGNPAIKVLSFNVFDRWGELVFASQDVPANDPSYGWDGTFKGKPMNTGVFGWIAKVEFPDGTQAAFRGNVTLVR